MTAAAQDDRILISADTDFGELLANSPVLAPSVILLRRSDKRADAVTRILLENLDCIRDDLAEGAVVVIGDRRMRARRLPIEPPEQPPSDE